MESLVSVEWGFDNVFFSVDFSAIASTSTLSAAESFSRWSVGVLNQHSFEACELVPCNSTPGKGAGPLVAPFHLAWSLIDWVYWAASASRN